MDEVAREIAEVEGNEARRYISAPSGADAGTSLTRIPVDPLCPLSVERQAVKSPSARLFSRTIAEITIADGVIKIRGPRCLPSARKVAE